MAIPSLPTPLEQLGNRPFLFYPAILGIEPNEWTFRRATWPEVLVTHVQSSVQIAIPRRFLGEVSRVEEPVVIVGLLKELEYRDGSVWPYRRTVLQMPMAVGAESQPDLRYANSARCSPAPVIAISLHAETPARRSRMVIGALVAGILAALVLAGALRDSHPRTRTIHRQAPR